MTDTNTLAPCPFCGERAETDFIPEHHSYQIECSDSIGCTVRITRDSELGAIEAWNCRAALAAPAQPVAWLHDCAALLTNDVELWIDACPHCGKPHNAPQPAAVLASGPVGFDHKTAANFLNGKTVTDEEVRQFVAHSRWAHDDRDGLRNTIADLRREIARRDAEIALLKTSLLDVEATQPTAQPLEDVPDMFWDADDTENFAHEIQDIIDGYGPGEIVTIECAKRLPNFRAVVTRDGDGISYEYLEAANAAQQGEAT